MGVYNGMKKCGAQGFVHAAQVCTNPQARTQMSSPAGLTVFTHSLHTHLHTGTATW